MVQKRGDGLVDRFARLQSFANIGKDAKVVGKDLIKLFERNFTPSQGGETTPPDDRGHFFGDSKLSSQVFDLDKQTLTGTNPRFVWQYFVQIKVNPSVVDGAKGIAGFSKQLSELMAHNNNLSPLIKQVEMPSMSMHITKSNAYNRRRISQRKIDFEPLTIVMHDVVNGVTLRFWELYYKYYYLDGLNKDIEADDDITPGVFEHRNFGLAMNGADSSGKYLIDYIDIFQIHGGGGKRIRIVHPLISKFKHSNHTYEANELSELTFTFEYEYAVYEDRIIATDDGATFRDPFTGGPEWDDLREYFSFQRFIDVDIEGYTPGLVYPAKNDQLQEQRPGDPELFPQTRLGQLGKVLEGVFDVGRSVAGEVAKVSALGNQFNKIQEDLFGKRIVDIPTVDVRNFTAKISKVEGKYQDINRVTKATGRYLGVRNESKGLSTTDRDPVGGDGG